MKPFESCILTKLLLVRVLLTQEDYDAGATADEIFAVLEGDYGGKLSVQLLNLEILGRDKEADGQEFYAGLRFDNIVQGYADMNKDS